jgi:hypothetical protein
MVAVLIKALFLYFMFVVARGVYRTIKSVKTVQEAAGNATKKSSFKRKKQEDVIEAEYRHLD